MRFLIVGLGSIGERHVRNLLALGQREIGVVRRSHRPTRGLKGDEFTTYLSLEEGLESKPDAVIVANPTALHVPVAQRSLEAGAHVLMEIPLSDSLAGVERLRAEADRAKRVVLMGHNLRFHPCLARMKALIDAGALGRPLSLRADFGQYLPDCHPWDDYRQRYEARKDLGGGVLFTSIHEVDHALWLMGRVTSVGALTARVSDLDLDVEDLAILILQHELGAVSNIQLDYLARPYSRSCQVIGSEGTVLWDFLGHRLTCYSAAARRWDELLHLPDYDFNDTYVEELKHFMACIRGEAQPLNDLCQGMDVLRVGLAARAAGEERRFVQVAPEEGG